MTNEEEKEAMHRQYMVSAGVTVQQDESYAQAALLSLAEWEVWKCVC